MCSKECGVVRERRGVGKDFCKQGCGGHSVEKYWLTLATAKEMSMPERNAQDKHACGYLIALR